MGRYRSRVLGKSSAEDIDIPPRPQTTDNSGQIPIGEGVGCGAVSWIWDGRQSSV